jgi:putative flippase GtrA
VINLKWNLFRFFKYIVGQILNISVNTLVNFIFYNITSNKMIAFIIATGIAMFVNFIFQNYIVFRSKEKVKWNIQ